jgi:hypothetical protein
MIITIIWQKQYNQYLATSEGNEMIKKGRGRKKSRQKRKMAGWK